MTQKVALITGGGRGIGRAIALNLAEKGWAVAICYRKSEGAANATLKAIQEKGAPGLALRCDVSDPIATAGLVQRIENEWGRIDALINGAGPYHRVNLFDETIEGWHEMFDNNLHPVFYLSRAVAPGMKARQWGRIINFCVANADQLVGQPFVTAYYVAKVGVLVLTRTLAKMLAPEGITVNAISPGVIDSGSVPHEELSQISQSIPAGYIGTTNDVSSVVNFLLSDEARYVNGANIHVSGGWGI
ncbi:MAG: SDR family oxidoreductase [candidate division KSB1 bacterium]|nr:SDR family oxidoreductase [candidate division KSB1 bacterium]